MDKSGKILVTGSTGKLGRILLGKLKENSWLAPSKNEMDITKKEEVAKYFDSYKISCVIHCAALTKMLECENNPGEAIKVNVEGTINLAKEALKKDVRFFYISTDYVYPGVNGPYKEEDPTVPFTIYGWSKLGGECAVKTIKKHCIIRTSLFDPNNLPFDTAPMDAFFSKISYSELVEAIVFLLNSEFTGTINIGQDRISAYDLFKKYRPGIKAVTLKDIEKELPFKNARAKDSSLDIGLWKNVKTLQ